MLFVSGKMFVLFGAVLLIIGGIALLLAKFGVHRVPGDIVLKRGGVTFFFPIVSCIILSVVLSLVMALFRRR